MKSNKILALKNVVFNLPDDFEGDLTDALELLVKYRRSDECLKRRMSDNQCAKAYDTISDVVDGIWNSDEHKCHIEALILGLEDGQWVNMLADDNKLK